MIKVRVPATTANVGAGFDCMGLAVSLYNYVYMDLSQDLDIASLDDFKTPTTESNLIYQSAMHLFNFCNARHVKSLKIRQRTNIPVKRGLGSSSACIVAGLVGANAILGYPLKKNELLNMALKLEGHPDNVAPAIFGEFVVCAVDAHKVYFSKSKVSRKLKFVFFIPTLTMETHHSRGILKENLTLTDAVFNISRASFLVSSLLNGRFFDLKIGVQDKIHQDVRIKEIKNADLIFKLAYQEGAYGVYLSGAGSSIVAVCDRSNIFFEKNIIKRLKDLKIYDWYLFNFKVDGKGAIVKRV